MKRFRVPVALLLFLALAGVKVDHDWPEFSIAAESARLDLLGVVLTDPGNAALVYAPYLKDEAPLVKSEIWNQVGDLRFDGLDDPASQETLTQGLEAAKDDLAKLKQASRMKDYVWWGKVQQLDPNKDILAQPTPSYVNLLVMAKLLTAESRRLEQAGDVAGAKESLLAMGRMGRQLCGDQLLLSFMVGNALKSHAASSMAGLLERQGNRDGATAWKLYEDMCQTVGRSWRKLNGLDAVMSESQFKDLELNEDIPFAFRFELLIWRHYCVSAGNIGWGTLRCMVTDTPDYVLEIEDELAKRDPQYKMFIDILKAKKPGDLISLREWLASP